MNNKCKYLKCIKVCVCVYIRMSMHMCTNECTPAAFIVNKYCV